MAKSPKKPKDEDIEIAPDAWERFEKAMDVLSRTPPKPKEPKQKKKSARR